MMRKPTPGDIVVWLSMSDRSKPEFAAFAIYSSIDRKFIAIGSPTLLIAVLPDRYMCLRSNDLFTLPIIQNRCGTLFDDGRITTSGYFLQLTDLTVCLRTFVDC